MAPEQAVGMARADAEPCGEILDARTVERAVADQPHRPMHRRARALPGRRERRRLGPAAQAGPEARRLGGGRGGIELDILALCRPHRADRPAVDAPRARGPEEAAVATTV